MQRGSWIRTPFFEREVFSSADHHRLNELYSHFTIRAEFLRSNGDWDGFIALHLASHREQAFFEVSNEIPAPDRNRIAGQIWTDPEIIQSGSCFILAATQTDPPHCTYDIMTEDERSFLRSLPEMLTVFRSHETWNQLGPCWSLQEVVAERFGYGYDWPNLTSAQVPRSSVLGYFNRRNEDEIVIQQPSDIKVIDVRNLPQRTTEP